MRDLVAAPPGISIDPALGGPPQGGAPVPPPCVHIISNCCLMAYSNLNLRYGFSFIPPGGAQQRFGPPPAGFSYGTIQMAPQPPTQAQGRANAGAGSSSNAGGELHDVSTLNDSLASAGVDLRVSCVTRTCLKFWASHPRTSHIASLSLHLRGCGISSG